MKKTALYLAILSLILSMFTLSASAFSAPIGEVSVRDGIFAHMFQQNNRNLASGAARYNTIINNALQSFYE